MADNNLSSLLKWSVENTAPSQDSNSSLPKTPSSSAPSDPQPPSEPAARGLNAQALASLFGGPSDADLMRESMAAILSPSVSLDNKLVAFDNLEQLIESIDNANNMESLGLWTPLIEQLQHDEAEMRKMAAWCLGTAVQNNIKGQERLLVIGGIPQLIKLATSDEDVDVKKKAIRALSSAVRNYQPALDAAQKTLPDEFRCTEEVDAENMEEVDRLMDKLRENANRREV